MHLTVVSPFMLNNQQVDRGAHITDPADVAKVMVSHPNHVTQHHPHHEHFYKTDAELAAIRAGVAAPAVMAPPAEEPTA